MSVRHAPPAAAREVLGPVANLFTHPDTKPIRESYHGASFLCRLPGGELYFESKLELDTDGSVYAKQDETGNKDGATSATDADGRFLDADTVNYFVLPRGGFAARHGIQLGDIAAVVYGRRLAFACFGDMGPSSKLGEGSIALLRALGAERVAGGKLRNEGIEGVATVVFPNSRRLPDDPVRHPSRVGVSSYESESRGLLRFMALQAAGLKHERQVLDGFQTRQVGLPRGGRAELVRRLRPWVDELVAATHHPALIAGRKPAEHLLATADGLDSLLAPAPPGQPAGKTPPPPTPVHARFDQDKDADGRLFVSHITFSLDPPPPGRP